VVQGFGSMGGGTARYLARKGVRVVGVVDVEGCVVHPQGFDVEALLAARSASGELDRSQLPGGAGQLPREDWLDVEAEVLVPAAGGSRDRHREHGGAGRGVRRRGGQSSPQGPRRSSGVTDSLAGRAALVTGSTRGIGRAIAEALAAAGARVVVNSRDAAAAEAAARDLGGGAVGVGADLGDPEGAERLVAAALEAFDGLDILGNNAGMAVA